MFEETFNFSLPYKTETIASAARAYSSYRLRERFATPLMFGAYFLWAVGIWVVVRYSKRESTTGIFGLLAVFLLCYMAWRILLFPRALARSLRKHLREVETVSLSSSGVTIHGARASAELKWFDVKRVIEFPRYFFVLPAIGFVFLPKEEMPADAQLHVRKIAGAQGKYVARD